MKDIMTVRTDLAGDSVEWLIVSQMKKGLNWFLIWISGPKRKSIPRILIKNRSIESFMKKKQTQL